MAFLTTLVLTLIGALVASLFQHYRETGRGSVPAGSRQGWRYPAAALGGAAAAYLLQSLVIAPWIFPPPKGPVAVIDQPADGASVDHGVAVQGTVDSLDKGDVLWLLVIPAEAPSYHPQPGPLPLGRGGRWSGVAYVGTPGTADVGKRFTIVLAEAEARGDAKLREYMDRVRATKVYPGLTDLPPGVTPLALLRVSRQ